MTDDRDRKALIRARMARTGESYLNARRHLLRERFEPLIAGLDDRDNQMLFIEQLRAALPDSRDPVLHGLLHAPSALVRKGCALVLDHAEQEQQVQQALQAATTDRDWRVRRAALHALTCAPCKPDGCLPARTLEHIITMMLNDYDRRVRLGCAGGLMFHAPDPRITAAFQYVLAHDKAKKMRHRAAYYLAATEYYADEQAQAYWRKLEFWTRLAQLTPDNYMLKTRERTFPRQPPTALA